MKPVYDYVVKPLGGRYNNSKKIGGKELILNTEIFNHEFVNREAIVKSVPLHNPLHLIEGDVVILHHNVFRRWHNIKGIEKNGRGFISDDEHLVQNDQIFMYKRDDNWYCTPGYTFVKPIVSKDALSLDKEVPLVGVVKYSDGSFLPTQLVGFSPNDEFEFIVDGERLYRIMNKFISIEYEYKGNEEEYNPSWAQSRGRVN